MAGVGQFLVDYVQPGTEKFLGIDDEATKAREDARIAAQERINMAGFDANSNILSDNSNMNQDGYEDTLSHLLAGAYTTSEGGLDLGKRTGNALLNLREHFTDEGEEKNIDINNNNLGKIIAEFRLSKAGGGLKGDALKEQILEDSKMLAASVSKFSNQEQKTVQEYLYNKKNGLMHQLDNFLGSGRDINTMMPMLSTKGMNKGGIMDKQMVKAFAVGGEVTDPISGNEVPEGSFPNEVRDDVPAMLSEGEYVVPADVLRFYGLKFFEDLRENAKIELQRMSQDGRMGGEPVQESMGESQALTDTDVDNLESMMRNANNGSEADVVEMAEGGLIDKLVHTIKTDNGVNQRLAKGGVVIKMAPGGLVSSSLYQDPTKMDEIIKEVTAASKTNPALFQRLASKGVVLDKTNATMNPEEMIDKNKPMFDIETGEELVTANEGGLIGYSHGGYHGDLFSTDPFKKQDPASTVDERYSNETGEIITKHYKIVDGIKMLTGYTRDSNPDRKFSIPPLEIPAGFNQLITAPTTELDNLNVTNESDQGLPDSADKNNDGIPDQSQVDTTSWANEVDFNNPESVQSWMDNNQKSQIPGIIGKAINVTSEFRGNVIGAVTTNDAVKSMVEDYKSQWGKKTGFVRGFITTPNKTQIGLYSDKQSLNFTPENVGGSITGKGTGFSGDNTGYSFGVPTPGDTGFGSMSVGEEGRLSGGNTMSGGSSSSSSNNNSSSTTGGGSTSGTQMDPDGSMGNVGSGISPGGSSSIGNIDPGDKDFMNKGGLASKKSKKGYNKGGYSTKKKMNTGGLVKKKKKK